MHWSAQVRVHTPSAGAYPWWRDVCRLFSVVGLDQNPLLRLPSRKRQPKSITHIKTHTYIHRARFIAIFAPIPNSIRCVCVCVCACVCVRVFVCVLCVGLVWVPYPHKLARYIHMYRYPIHTYIYIPDKYILERYTYTGPILIWPRPCFAFYSSQVSKIIFKMHIILQIHIILWISL